MEKRKLLLFRARLWWFSRLFRCHFRIAIHVDGMSAALGLGCSGCVRRDSTATAYLRDRTKKDKRVKVRRDVSVRLGEPPILEGFRCRSRSCDCFFYADR